MKKSLVLLLLGLLLTIGCVTGQLPKPSPLPESLTPAGLRPQDYPSQRIFRVRYQGDGGQASFRLIVRLRNEEHYQLSAADPLGRQLWALEFEHPELHYIDYRAQLACRTRQPVTIAELALETLSLRELPAVLLGRLPRGLVATGGGSGEMRDAAGRRWTVGMVAAAVEHWTLWEGSRPLLWFQTVERGGILSHRRGSQFRWRQTLVEAMDGRLPQLPEPEGAVLVDCAALGARESPFSTTSAN